MARKSAYKPDGYRQVKQPAVSTRRTCPIHAACALERPPISMSGTMPDYCPKCHMFWNAETDDGLRACVFAYLRDKHYTRNADPLVLQAAQNEIEAFFMPALRLTYEQRHLARVFVVQYVERRELSYGLQSDASALVGVQL